MNLIINNDLHLTWTVIGWVIASGLVLMIPGLVKLAVDDIRRDGFFYGKAAARRGERVS